MPSKKNATPRKRPLVLPIIAPKDDLSISDLSLDTLTRQASIPKPRSRFPPRSRTGCWICRSRKVKCDEGHPQCNQCTRLGRICDYRPRLPFRDDTRRVIERMPDITTAGNRVWDPNASPRTESISTETATHDLLPPFPLLTSDEERERKAQSSKPGTYHVVVIPESFSHLPEYVGNASEEAKGRGSTRLSSITESGQFATGAGNSNVIILKRFKDTRCLTSRYWSPSQSPSDLRESSLSAATIDATSQDADDDPIYDLLEQENQDAILLGHFRDVVRILVPAGDIFDIVGGNLDADVFDREAINFPPLFHAMMAISALSLDQKSDVPNIDGLQYYHQASLSFQNSIQSDEDLLSDGLFLTNFLLLVYELAAAGLDGSSLWSHHISRILHISSLRRATLGTERYPSIIWWVCTVDLYALLSGAGTGLFVQAALANPDLLPEPDSFQYPVPLDRYHGVSQEDNHLWAVFHLHRDTFLLAARLGFLAAESRRINMSFPYSHQEPREKEARELREELWRLWNSPEALFLLQAQESLPPRLQDIIRQSSLLFHTSLLFSYTSIWPGQRFGQGAALEEQIHHHTIPSSACRVCDSARQGDPTVFCHLPRFPGGGCDLLQRTQDDGSGIAFEPGDGKYRAQCSNDMLYISNDL